MILPLYVALEKIDRRLIEAATDLYASRLQAFLRITFILSLPGVVAGSLLTFIPAVGDFINAEIIGASNPDSIMIGNVIQFEFINANDYPAAAAWRSCSSSGSWPWSRSTPGLVGSERLTEDDGVTE